jgi:hypothetical protein
MTHRITSSSLRNNRYKDTASPWIEKYEIGIGPNKINVRIFKEPATEPVLLESQKDVRKKQVDALLLRLKKIFWRRQLNL